MVSFLKTKKSFQNPKFFVPGLVPHRYTKYILSFFSPQSACSVMSNAKHGVINSNSPPCIGQTCSDFKPGSSTSTASVMSSPVAATSALSQKSSHHTVSKKSPKMYDNNLKKRNCSTHFFIGIKFGQSS